MRSIHIYPDSMFHLHSYQQSIAAKHFLAEHATGMHVLTCINMHDGACCIGAREVVMLDYEPLALQCALLSAKASGLISVQDYRLHETNPSSASIQQPSIASQGTEGAAHLRTDSAADCAPIQVKKHLEHLT